MINLLNGTSKIVTGSARGFGFCQAKKFKELGYNVVISDVTEANLEKALSELNEINKENTSAIKVKCDVTKIELPEKTKKIYNILGDYPETIVNYVVPRMIKNEKNDKQIIWLTNRRAFGRFMTAGFSKRDFFKDKVTIGARHYESTGS